MNIKHIVIPKSLKYGAELQGAVGSLGLVDISYKAAEWERLLRDGASWYKLDHSLIDDYNMVCNEIISVTKNWVMDHEVSSGITLSDEEFANKLSELRIALKGSDTVSREIIAELLKTSKKKYTWLEDVELCISYFDFSEALKIIAENT